MRERSKEVKRERDRHTLPHLPHLISLISLIPLISLSRLPHLISSTDHCFRGADVEDWACFSMKCHQLNPVSALTASRQFGVPNAHTNATSLQHSKHSFSTTLRSFVFFFFCVVFPALLRAHSKHCAPRQTPLIRHGRHTTASTATRRVACQHPILCYSTISSFLLPRQNKKPRKPNLKQQSFHCSHGLSSFPHSSASPPSTTLLSGCCPLHPGCLGTICLIPPQPDPNSNTQPQPTSSLALSLSLFVFFLIIF